ncbi:hypothetical protein B0F90DRAFT_1721164 [Multifurca ochricompacta]|uniref:Zn(2)-C6 fungal-type domain-containing protein n=1 Tax=Multifurca ochricompacta TaxID=376703 RepID=A0AAD4QKZ0_9AGAM|nr:hypothetical protein B0F90DRAFT_1721164 [Multifurca ochricompacta]
MMQAGHYIELSRGPRTQVNEVYLNGSQYPQYQNEAIENVYYWYDGTVPYCTDATACQPLDDNFLHMNAPGYWYAGAGSQGAHQLINFNPHVDIQGSPHSYTLQHYEAAPLENAPDHNPLLSFPTSPCTSLSSLPWSDSELSPTACQHTNDTDRLSSAPPPPPRETSTGPSGSVRTSLPPPAALDSTRRDVLGRRAPKQRRITRAVQPLACYFCRGRKIACGPPANLGSGDRTCEPCARRRLVCEYPAESYRGRRPSGSKRTL